MYAMTFFINSNLNPINLAKRNTRSVTDRYIRQLALMIACKSSKATLGLSCTALPSLTPLFTYLRNAAAM